MKLKTVMTNKIPKKLKKTEAIMLSFFFAMQILFNTIFPFTLGVLFANTKNIFILPILILFITINIKVEHKENGINVEIVKNFYKEKK